MDVTTKPLLRFTGQLVHNSMYFVVFMTSLRESRKLKIEDAGVLSMQLPHDPNFSLSLFE